LENFQKRFIVKMGRKKILPEKQAMTNLETIQNNSNTTAEPQTHSKGVKFKHWTSEGIAKYRLIPEQ